jgi:hypothetical protein
MLNGTKTAFKAGTILVVFIVSELRYREKSFFLKHMYICAQSWEPSFEILSRKTVTAKVAYILLI